MVGVAMREDCKYFQRRVSPSGEPAQFCALGLAPEAPWRCPGDCPRYTRRPDLPAVSDSRGDRSDEQGLDPDAVLLLSSAEEIIGAVGPEIEAERRREREEERRRAETWWARIKDRSARWRR